MAHSTTRTWICGRSSEAEVARSLRRGPSLCEGKGRGVSWEGKDWPNRSSREGITVGLATGGEATVAFVVVVFGFVGSNRAGV